VQGGRRILLPLTALIPLFVAAMCGHWLIYVIYLPGEYRDALEDVYRSAFRVLVMLIIFVRFLVYFWSYTH
jgi:hypothetical protein